MVPFGGEQQGGFWFALYKGGLNSALFVVLLRQMMKVDVAPSILSSTGCLRTKVETHVITLTVTLHFLPGYAPDLNPDELVWSYAKCTGVARSPLRSGEKLADRVQAQLSNIKARPNLVRSFFKHPGVAYISDL